MGRRKIEIQPITHERNRTVTFLKRKQGLFKKAYELGVLCSVDIAVVVFEERANGRVKLHQYCSSDIDEFIQRRLRYRGDSETTTLAHFVGPNAAADDDEHDVEHDDEDEVENVPNVAEVAEVISPPLVVPLPAVKPVTGHGANPSSSSSSSASSKRSHDSNSDCPTSQPVSPPTAPRRISTLSRHTRIIAPPPPVPDPGFFDFSSFDPPTKRARVAASHHLEFTHSPNPSRTIQRAVPHHHFPPHMDLSPSLAYPDSSFRTEPNTANTNLAQTRPGNFTPSSFFQHQQHLVHAQQSSPPPGRRFHVRSSHPDPTMADLDFDLDEVERHLRQPPMYHEHFQQGHYPSAPLGFASVPANAGFFLGS